MSFGNSLIRVLAGAALGAGLVTTLGAGSGPLPAPVLAAPAALPAVAATDSYADLVERVAPTVVTIRTEAVVRTDIPIDPFHRFFRQPPPAQRRGGLGSGVVVSADGYVLTNHHVVEGAQRIAVELSDRRTLDATLIGSDPPSDLAVLKIEGDGFESLPLGDAGLVRVGDVVLAFGNPLGVGQTVTMGIISAKGRSTGLGDGGYEDFLQTDAPINRGNSGGPLVSTRGELVGINTQILSQTGGSIGIGFAIPADMAAHVMRQLIDRGEVRRGRLGVTVQGLSSDLAQSLGLDEVSGALVSTVDPDGPAERAGLRRGDVVLELDGEPVRDSNDLRNRIAQAGPGASVRLDVDRAGERRQLAVTLAELEPARPGAGSAGAQRGEGRFGMSVAPLTPEMARRLGVEPERGVVIAEIDPAGPAASAGLRRGDVIEEVNREGVASLDELKSALDRSGDGPALVLVNRGGTALYLTLKPRG